MSPVTVTLLVDAISYPLTGIGRYAWELVQAVEAARADTAQPLVANYLSYLGAHDFPELAARATPHAVRTVPPLQGRMIQDWIARAKTFLIDFRLVSAAYRLRQDAAYGKHLARASPRVVHGLNFKLPKRLPAACRGVVTIHDLSAFIEPDWHPRQRVERLRQIVPEAIGQADCVIAISQSTAREVTQWFPQAADRVRVIPLGVSEAFFTPMRPGAVRTGALCVSTIEPRKNILALLAAYERLPAALRAAHPLTLVGAYGWQSQREHEAIDRAKRAGWLRFLGYVPEPKLIELLASARVVVYPSLYEGFGLPVLEAMAAGTPVIAGRHSSIIEVAGDHATLVSEVRDADALANAIEGELAAPWREDLARARIEHARGFGWARTTAETLSLYRQLGAW
ncbi:MAG: glycosyltransferase family 4 protein [Casimicrobiaceae bacterium]